MNKMKVLAIEFAWVDPWTEEFCCGWRMPWSKKRAARSYYSRQIKNMKRWAKEFCTGPRTPKLQMRIVRADAATPSPAKESK